jgi:hypothetical protein
MPVNIHEHFIGSEIVDPRSERRYHETVGRGASFASSKELVYDRSLLIEQALIRVSIAGVEGGRPVGIESSLVVE